MRQPLSRNLNFSLFLFFSLQHVLFSFILNNNAYFHKNKFEVNHLNAEFSRTLSLLRQEKGVSQRSAAEVLGISQALLSHYENGIREPGLSFVVRACDYYGVSADFLLGRTLSRDGTTIAPEELYDLSDEKNNSLKGGVLALLSKKLLVNSIGVLFDLLAKTGSRDAIRAAANYLSTAIYQIYRRLYQANPDNNPDFFSVSPRHFEAGLPQAEMHCSEAELIDALAAHAKEKGPMPEMTNDALARDYPVLYQSLLQTVHTAGERINGIMNNRPTK
jgi:transcriptional regulator with XRE-family HTH domain